MFSGSSAAHLFNSSHLHNTATVNRDAARHFPSINDNYETLLGREASHGRRAPTERRFFFLVTGCVTQWRGTIDKGKMCVKGRTPTPAGPGKGQSRCQRPGGERERGEDKRRHMKGIPEMLKKKSLVSLCGGSRRGAKEESNGQSHALQRTMDVD